MIRAMTAGPVLDERHKKNGHSTPRASRSETSPSIEPRHAWYVRCKPVLDVVAAVIMLLAASPVVIVCAVLVKLTSPGPAFYCQTRLGRNGRPFRIYKLRTMCHDAEALTGPVWSTKGDPRVTPIGWVLRETHLDEFPQLINVVLGQMSLIGPRPERPEIVSKLEWEVPHYRQRLKVRPGITGLAQVKLPPDSDVESVRRKLMHDLYYVQHVSPWLDLRILCCTAASFFLSLMAFAWRPLALPNCDAVEAELGHMACLELYSSTSVAQPGLKG